MLSSYVTKLLLALLLAVGLAALAGCAEAWARMREGFVEASSAFRKTWRETESELGDDT